MFTMKEGFDFLSIPGMEERNYGYYFFGCEIEIHSKDIYIYGNYIGNDICLKHMCVSMYVEKIIREVLYAYGGTILSTSQPTGIYKKWLEYVAATKDFSLKEKSKWLKINNYKTYTLCLISKEYFPKAILTSVIVDNKKRYALITSLQNDSNYYQYRSQWYCELDYEINGLKTPLSIIILHFEICPECEVEGIYTIFDTRDGCPVCSTKYKILEYHTKAEQILPFKHGGEKHPLYLGIELEYQQVNNNRQNIKTVYNSLKDHIIVKRDGSLNSGGIEIATAPATLTEHKKAFSGFFERVDFLRPEKQCGMHVHVDRKNIKELQLGKLIAFIYNIKNKNTLVKIAGRDFYKNRFCTVDKERTFTHKIRSEENWASRLFRSDMDRYTALNITPSKTIEFRIFSSPRTEFELFSKIEFVKSLIDFTMPGTVGIPESKEFNNLKEYVLRYKKIYPNFSKFIIQENL